MAVSVLVVEVVYGVDVNSASLCGARGGPPLFLVIGEMESSRSIWGIVLEEPSARRGGAGARYNRGSERTRGGGQVREGSDS